MKKIPLALLCGLALFVPPLANADLASSIISAIPPGKRSFAEVDKLTLLLREIDAYRQAGTKPDDKVLARLDSTIATAHQKGVPLALMLFTQSPDDEMLRLRLATEIVKPDTINAFGLEAFDLLVDGVLAARDAPLSIFAGKRKQQDLDYLVRLAAMKSIVQMVNPSQAENVTFGDAGAAKLLEMLVSSLNRTELTQAQREQIKRAVDRVKTFQAKPPPYLSPRWREAAAQLQNAASKWGKAAERPASQSSTSSLPPEPNPKAKPAP